MAVRVGFEPTEPVKVQRFSRPPDSTALAPHRSRILPFPNNVDQLSYTGFFIEPGTVTTIREKPTARLLRRDWCELRLQDRRQPRRDHVPEPMPANVTDISLAGRRS